MGYRFDFEKMKITLTGGIYVRTFPTAEKITIDSKIKGKPGMFANSIFVQSLLPGSHTVLVEKNGYYNYFKTIPVQEKEVTKLENILLFKKNVRLTVVADQTQTPFNALEKFILKNNNLYYSASPENLGLTATQKATPILKKITAFAMSPSGGSPAGRQNNNIVWLGTDGLVYKSDPANLSAQPIKLTLTPIEIIKNKSYKIITLEGHPNGAIFINNNGNLLLLNTKTSELDSFADSVKDAKISPDGKNIVYYNDNNIYISPIPNTRTAKYTLYKSSEKISNCLWLNNHYIIFVVGSKIIISEIDYRGEINTVTLPQTADKIFFNTQDSKLYILVEKTLLLSEKLIP